MREKIEKIETVKEGLDSLPSRVSIDTWVIEAPVSGECGSDHFHLEKLKVLKKENWELVFNL